MIKTYLLVILLLAEQWETRAFSSDSRVALQITSGSMRSYQPGEVQDTCSFRVYSNQAGRNLEFEEEWGVSDELEKALSPEVDLSSTVEQAFLALASTISGKSANDINIASNARSRGMFTRRPVRRDSDVGRCGVEIDGMEHLFEGKVSAGQAMRHFSIKLAAKLSTNKNWESFEGSNQILFHSTSRPVSLFFGTIKQALAASRELQSLKASADSLADRSNECYDNITIKCLGDDIPKEFKLNPSKRRRKGGLQAGYVNATKGIVIIIQPTDFNSEFPPPGPSVGALSDFQQLVARAAAHEIPVIAVSPRFQENDSPYRGWDQSGYERASTYGGSEPASGPTPWILRDFVPPVYCWIGDAMKGDVPPRRSQADSILRSYISRVAMTQSVADFGRSWHIFAVKEIFRGNEKLSSKYVYVCSTRSASGRPTRDVIRRIIQSRLELLES